MIRRRIDEQILFQDLADDPDAVWSLLLASGYGRYDTMVIPRDISLPPTVLEFKVVDAYDGTRTLEDAVASAHTQIAERNYDAELLDRGFAPEQIRHFGVAFQGKHVLVG